MNIEEIKNFADHLELINYTSQDEMINNYWNTFQSHTLNYWLDQFNGSKSKEIMKFIKSKTWVYDRIMNDYLYKI